MPTAYKITDYSTCSKNHKLCYDNTESVVHVLSNFHTIPCIINKKLHQNSTWLKYRTPHHSNMKWNPCLCGHTVLPEMSFTCNKQLVWQETSKLLSTSFWFRGWVLIRVAPEKIGVFKQGGVFCTCSQYTYHLLQNMELIEYAITKSSFARSKGCNWNEHYQIRGLV